MSAESSEADQTDTVVSWVSERSRMNTITAPRFVTAKGTHPLNNWLKNGHHTDMTEESELSSVKAKPKRRAGHLQTSTKVEDGDARNTTLALSVYGKLRAEILDAILLPGKKIKVRDICSQYGVGVSPVREALNRLFSDGLVSQTAQRGFTVATVSVEDLEELGLARRWLNEIGLRQSISRGDAAWEERVLVGFHRLSRQDRADTAKVRNPDWHHAHRQFHSDLLDACGSRWLVKLCEMLFDASERYRAIARLKGDPTRDALAEHREIMTATIERNADRAVDLLNRHFDRTNEQVKASLLERTAHK